LAKTREALVDLICYLHSGWKPHIRPAEATRQWMTETPEAFAYRCLPLNIANSQPNAAARPPHKSQRRANAAGGRVQREVIGSREAAIDQSPETPTVVAARRASFRVVNRIA
jgi:hypothetical protein